jgi:hypothetical protein
MQLADIHASMGSMVVRVKWMLRFEFLVAREKRDSEAMMIVHASPSQHSNNSSAPSTPESTPTTKPPTSPLSYASDTSTSTSSSSTVASTSAKWGKRKHRRSMRASMMHRLPSPTDNVAVEVIHWELPIRVVVPEYPADLVFSPRVPTLILR